MRTASWMVKVGLTEKVLCSRLEGDEGRSSVSSEGKVQAENDLFTGPEMEACLACLWSYEASLDERGRKLGNEGRMVMGTRCCRACRSCALHRVGIYWRVLTEEGCDLPYVLKDYSSFWCCE